MHKPEPVNLGVAHQIGRYADAVHVPVGHEQIFVSGTPGLAGNGALADNITDQATQAWHNVEAILAKAGASLSDIVSVRQWLVSADEVADYVAVRNSVIKHETASMLAVVPALVWPNIKVEIEVVAVKPTAN